MEDRTNERGMIRIAIVAASEELRSALATALRANPTFEVVGTGRSVDDVSASADVVLVARVGPGAGGAGARSQVAPSLAGDAVSGPALSNREREILALLADGLGNKQIAARLGISTNTVQTHLELLFEKLGAGSRAEAVAIGVRRGLLLL